MFGDLLFGNPTVDGWNPAPPGMYETPTNNGNNYQPQLVRWISAINSIICWLGTQLSSVKNPYDIPWNPDWFIGILVSWSMK